MSVTFATGADSNLFWNACALQESFVTQNPGDRLVIADFGLHPRQIAFLQDIGCGVAWPPHLKRLPHAWYYKTALSDFPGLDVDGLAWLDSDMVVVGPAAEHARRIALEMSTQGCTVAVCTDASAATLAEFIDAFRDRSVEPFERMLHDRGVGLDKPYLNTGFVIVGDRSFWKAWRTLTFKTPAHVAYDQSSFNALAHSHPAGVFMLDAATWNVHGPLLVSTDLGNGHGNVVRLLHATSQRHEHHVNLKVALPHGDVRAEIMLKTFRRSDLRAYHLRALQSFIRRHQHAITRHALLDL